jgi:hypothetical protein
MACHAGGQFPELTPYGRMFKLTGYTIGERTIPFAVMGVATYSKVANTDKDPDPQQTFAKNGSPLFAGGSLFIGGKITDNIGAFTQITYDNYSGQAVGASGNNDGRWQSHSSADNIDIRYADHFIGPNQDLIVGVSLNNNPSVSDVWNTADTWMQYVPAPSPGSSRFVDANAPYPDPGAGQVAGVTAYMLWNKTIYGEIGLYRTANQAFSFMSAGTPDAATSHLQGSNNPYWRFAYTHEWGPNNIMVGTSGMVAHVYDGSSTPSDSNAYSRIKTFGIDSQYQYLLDPHTVTAQVVYQRQVTNLSANAIAGLSQGYTDANGVVVPIAVDANGNPMAMPNTSNVTDIFRAKLSYVYQAKYGGSVSFFNKTGSTDSAAKNTVWNDPAGVALPNDLTAATTGNQSGNPATRGMTFEAFWLPIQNVRIGAQYTAYNKFNGVSSNYDGLGRNASDNNTLFLYVWGAY